MPSSESIITANAPICGSFNISNFSSLDLYDPNWKIYTKSEDLPPVKFGDKAKVSTSLISLLSFFISIFLVSLLSFFV